MLVYNPEVHELNYNFNYNPQETEALRALDYARLSINDIRRIALWKIARVVNIPDDILEALRNLVGENFNIGENDIDQKTTAILNQLVGCNGIGYPMASAILKFIRPDIFPIIDVRAYRALTGTKIRPYQYNATLYCDYARKLRRIARDLNRELSTIDEQLYCFDKEKNGAI